MTPSPDPTDARPQPERDRDLPTGFELAWGLRPTTRRGPKPGLSLERIIGVAVELADTNGLAAVSMSKVAKALGFAPMSLYRYVGSKDDLVLLMFDAALGDPPDLGPMLPWRAGVEKWARAILAGYREHVWVLDVLITGTPMTPHQLLWLDLVLQAFAETELDHEEQLTTALLIDGYVRSWVQLSRGLLQTEGPHIGFPSSTAVLRELVDAEHYPALAPMIAAGAFDDQAGDDVDEGFDLIFEFGLERVLDGIEVLVDRRSPP